MDYDILITNATILPLARDAAPIPGPGYVAVRGRTIAALGRMSELDRRTRAVTVIDGSGALVMPGLVNCHCHAPMTLFRGLADDLPLMTWLMDHIFPAEARTVDPEMVFWCAKLAAAEMILSGTTTVADGYFFESEIARAFVESGIRAVAAQGVIDFPAPGVPDPGENIRNAEAFITAWQGKDPLITPAVFCHSAYTCGPATLRKAKALARATDTRFFIHAAETREEVAEVDKRFGATPIAHLRNLDLLDERTVLIHCVHLSAEEKVLIKESGASVATCPESHMKLASGVAPVPELLDLGIPVGLGTDGCASNNDLDLFREMDTAAKLHKVAAGDPTVLPAGRLLGLATRGGAQVLGLHGKIGCLAPGYLADLIVLNLNQPRLTPFYGPDLLVYAASGADVTHVIIAGRQVLGNRELLTMDIREVMREVRKLSQKLRNRG